MHIFETSVVPDHACGDQVAVMRVHACAHVVLHVLAYRSHKNHVLSLSPVGHDRADFMLYAQIISSCCHPDGLAMVSPDVSCFRLQYAGW